jgi:hypothetical protein
MRLEGKITFCIECTEFSCERLNHLDKRYRTRYGTSPINNLVTIKKIGITNFVNAEEQKWTCPGCGAMLCMHKPVCLSCGYGWLVKIDSIP